MKLQAIHYISGLIVVGFTGLHLFNHIYGILGVEKHIEMMVFLRHFYRHPVIEIILFIAVIVLTYSGIILFLRTKKKATSVFEKLHRWTGLYLSFFFILHLGAILVGRYYLNLDTNFYYSGTGINTFPVNLFFIPYYAGAIFSFFGHIAAVHNKKMKHTFLGLTPNKQSKTILIIGVLVTFVIFLGQTNYFQGINIPKEYYEVLIGKVK